MQAYDACTEQNNGEELRCGEALAKAYQMGKRGDLSRAQQYLDAAAFSLCKGHPNMIEHMKDVVIDPNVSETSRYAGKWSQGIARAFEEALDRSDIDGQVSLIKDMVPCLKSDHTKPYPTMAQSFLADSIAQWYIRESAVCDQITKETGEDFSLDPVAKEISDVAPAVFANNKHYPQLESITLGAMREMGMDYESFDTHGKFEPQYIAAVEAPEVREAGVADRSMAFA